MQARSGLEALAPYLLPGKTLALIGTSGVGKSTLVNCLLGEERAQTGAIREADDRGRHTTTRRELFALPNGALVIDTPGMREFGSLAEEPVEKPQHWRRDRRDSRKR
jgi:ribosome biogenesis GTPase